MSVTRNILLSRPDRIGDVVVASSCLPVVRAQVTAGARLFFLVRENCAGLFCHHPALDGVVPIHGDGSDDPEKLAEKLRELEIDTVVHLHPSPVVAAAADKASITRQFSNDVSGNKNPSDTRHEAERNFAVLAQMGFSPPEKFAPSISPDSAALEELVTVLGDSSLGVERILPSGLGCLEPPGCRQDADNNTQDVCPPQGGFFQNNFFDEKNAGDGRGGFVVFHCGAHGKKMRLPTEIFIRVAEVLRIQNPTTKIVVIGDASPDENADRFIAEVMRAGDGVVDLRGKLSLAASAWVLKYAVTCLSRDSGPAHIATAMGCPTLTVFPENTPGLAGPTRWLPLGVTDNSHYVVSPVTRRWWEPWSVYRRRAVRAIDVAEVTEKFMQIFQQATAG